MSKIACSQFPNNNGWSRGHMIEFRDGKWVFADDGSPAPFAGGQERPCAKSGKLWGDSMPKNGEDIPDPRLGRIPGVKFACCGHGIIEQAYVVFEKGPSRYGISAIIYFETLRGEE